MVNAVMLAEARANVGNVLRITRCKLRSGDFRSRH